MTIAWALGEGAMALLAVVRGSALAACLFGCLCGAFAVLAIIERQDARK